MLSAIGQPPSLPSTTYARCRLGMAKVSAIRPKEWIEKRLRSMAVRGELTDEWKARGVQEGKEYAILTAEIARATFGVTPGAHKQLKGLGAVKTGNNLRDHMTALELIFTMLGEAGTTEIARKQGAQGLDPNRRAARWHGGRQRAARAGGQDRRAGAEQEELPGPARHGPVAEASSQAIKGKAPGKGRTT